MILHAINDEGTKVYIRRMPRLKAELDRVPKEACTPLYSSCERGEALMELQDVEYPTLLSIGGKGR